MTELATVPPSYIGLWQRKGIWRRDGTSDVTTLVLWFQAASFHIDLRVGQIAFAGTTVVEGNRCTWHPEIAFPFVSSELDTGLIRFDGCDRMLEAAIDGSYHEEWIRIAPGPVASSRQDDGGRVSYVLESADWLALANGLPDAASDFTFARRSNDGWRVHASTTMGREGMLLPPT